MIRPLDPAADRAALVQMYQATSDYWALDRLDFDAEALATEFLTDAPPNCDPAQSQRLGLFQGAQLAGVAELSFGFPAPGDAYLGQLMFADWARGQGMGAALLAEVMARARAKGCTNIYLGVLDTNPKGRTFWQRHGFADTGLSRVDTDGGITKTLRRLHKAL